MPSLLSQFRGISQLLVYNAFEAFDDDCPRNKAEKLAQPRNKAQHPSDALVNTVPMSRALFRQNSRPL